MAEQALQEQQKTAPAKAAEANTPMQMIQAAVERGVDADQLQRLMDLQERWEAQQARKAFDAAMAEFKAHPPQISKNRHVKFQTSKGVTEYDHATLDHIVERIGQAMAPHGLSFRWQTEQRDDGSVKVTCILSHVDGHSESAKLFAPPDNSGMKNGIQQIGSTITYLQRYTLLAATGLAAADQDDDGQSAGPAYDTVSAEQAQEIERKIDDVGADRGKVLAWLQVDAIENLPARFYQRAINGLEKKRKQQGGSHATA